jgi:DNA-directed RNA polymerase subunit RPC12/RpoP
MADARRARRTDRGMSCARCKSPMDELLRIAPTGHDQGLIAYECPSCGYVTSVLVAPNGFRSA